MPTHSQWYHSSHVSQPIMGAVRSTLLHRGHVHSSSPAPLGAEADDLFLPFFLPESRSFNRLFLMSAFDFFFLRPPPEYSDPSLSSDSSDSSSSLLIVTLFELVTLFCCCCSVCLCCCCWSNCQAGLDLGGFRFLLPNLEAISSCLTTHGLQNQTSSFGADLMPRQLQ